MQPGENCFVHRTSEFSESAGDSTDAQLADAKGNTSLSYKFQRLRREAARSVVSGELSGKLPGERQLAKRFNVNAKTLSKALTDLAAEGLLDRSIGRERSSKAPAPQVASVGRWLVLCPPTGGGPGLLAISNGGMQTFRSAAIFRRFARAFSRDSAL